MDRFKLVSPYQPTGDQPEAIDGLVAGIENGIDEQVLLGVTEFRQDLHDGKRYRPRQPADACSGA